MLAADERMRWWGMDMRSRRRRRWAVMVCYFVLSFLLIAIGIDSRWVAHPYIVLGVAVVVSCVWERVSIFGSNSPVKGLQDRRSIRLSGMGELVAVTGLDERARYKFGVESFEAASEEQKSELLNTHMIGTRWMLKDRDKTPGLDEREQREWDNAERWALQKLINLLAVFIYILISGMARHGGKLDGAEVVTDLLFLTFMAQTLAKARILWTEADPRELGGEMAVVGGVEA